MLPDKLGLPTDYTTSTSSSLVPNFKSDIESGPVDVRPEQGQGRDVDEESLSDVVAALVSAILALTFLLLLFCIIQIIKKRRRQLQGLRLNQPVIQTISPGAFTASPAAYSQHIPTASGISWERVDTQQRNEAIPDLQNYHRLSLSNPPLDSQEFYVSSSSRSSPHIQLFQGSSDIQFSEVLEVSTSLTSNDTVQSDELHPSSQDLFQLSAAPNSLSCLQMVQVDAVLHHTPPEVLGASGQCSSHPSCSGNPFSSRTPPLLRSYDHQYELAHGHKNPHLAEDVINRESNETFRPLRTIGHQYKLSQ